MDEQKLARLDRRIRLLMADFGREVMTGFPEDRLNDPRTYRDLALRLGILESEIIHRFDAARYGSAYICNVCGEPFAASRSDARYCSARCRVAAHRKRVTALTVPAVVEPVAEVSPAGLPGVGTTWDERHAAYLLTHDPAALQRDHEAGRHADLDEYPDGCAPCDAEAEKQSAEDEARYRADAKARAKAARAAERTFAAWIAANPDAIAYRCASCGEEFTGEGADQGQGPLYECGECGSPFTRDGSADGDSNRCPDCNKFGGKLADLACPECGEGELEPVTAVTADLA